MSPTHPDFAPSLLLGYEGRRAACGDVDQECLERMERQNSEKQSIELHRLCAAEEARQERERVVFLIAHDHGAYGRSVTECRSSPIKAEEAKSKTSSTANHSVEMENHLPPMPAESGSWNRLVNATIGRSLPREPARC